MIILFLNGLFIFKFTLVLTKEAELPLCPTNVLYFPQNLPMHCRMPTNADFPGISGSLPTVPQFYQSPPPNKHPPVPISIPVPPGATGPIPMPGSMPMPGPIPFPGPIAIPGPMAPPLSPGPGHKLPVMVMPFYSPDRSFKQTGRPKRPQHSFRPRKWKIRHRRRRPFVYSSSDTSSSTDTDTSSETSSGSSSEYEGWWKGRRDNRRFNRAMGMKKKRRYPRRQLLTPVLQYVTKDGYVIFEKRISKNEAKDWLNVKKDGKAEFKTVVSPEARDMESNEANDNHSGEKGMLTEDNVEVITKRTVHRLNRIKTHRDKEAKKKSFDRPL